MRLTWIRRAVGTVADVEISLLQPRGREHHAPVRGLGGARCGSVRPAALWPAEESFRPGVRAIDFAVESDLPELHEVVVQRAPDDALQHAEGAIFCSAAVRYLV